MPVSTSHKRRSRRRSNDSDSDDTEQTLRDLCSEIDKSDMCWNILKSELHRFSDSNDRDIFDGVIDLAIEKSKEIHEKINQWFSNSNNDKLKDKYNSCSKNYNDIDRNLEEARKNLDSDHYQKISDQINGAREKLNKCKHEFGADSFDPAHVRDRNNEIGLYLDMVRAAEDRLEDYDDDDDHKKN
ncbi:hypothetical protein C2S51_015682 [Perilla frutescens var. frutescens]|nr:hypothetical protein C2S51_015682 [Perilla frutescens var. frutescens]